MEEEERREQLNQEIADFGYNQLNELGNQAIKLKLIAGHGYHGGKYEILRQGEALLMSPQEAKTFLAQLIKEIGD
jgi:hypothetical protein